MILIADSGSTKTSWALVNEDHSVGQFQSSGFNPYVQKQAEITLIIQMEVVPAIQQAGVSKIFFYGAGCSTPENKKLMHDSFKQYFKDSIIEIEHDLMGAARALWFNSPGIVSILGTGSNSCVYNGKDIVDAVPSLGFILGDEGSGAYMGKMLVRDFLYLKMPENLAQKFKNQYQLDATTILNQVYKKENPNRWLASFSVFILENISQKYCKSLVSASIQSFFDAHLNHYKKYSDYPLGVIGSIGYYYKDILEDIASKNGFTLKKIIKSPIAELVKYHITNAA